MVRKLSLIDQGILPGLGLGLKEVFAFDSKSENRDIRVMVRLGLGLESGEFWMFCQGSNPVTIRVRVGARVRRSLRVWVKG